MHRESILIRSNEMQQYAGVYLLQNYSPLFGCLSRPSSGVHQTVTAASGTGHCVRATTFRQRGLIMLEIINIDEKHMFAFVNMFAVCSYVDLQLKIHMPRSKRSLIIVLLPFFWGKSPQWARASSFTRFIDHTHRCATVGRTPLDGWSARRRDLYLTTQNTHNRQTSMSPAKHSQQTDRHLCPRLDSNPQSWQASGRRPTS